MVLLSLRFKSNWQMTEVETVWSDMVNYEGETSPREATGILRRATPHTTGGKCSVVGTIMNNRDCVLRSDWHHLLMPCKSSFPFVCLC